MSAALRLAPQTREPSCFDAPAQAILEQLRAWKTGAYVCGEQDGRWLADCIVCGEHRAVRIDEHRPGGRVTVSCRVGCTAEQIGVALDRAVARDDPWEIAAAWEDVAGELQELVDDAVTLLAQQVPPAELPEAVAA